MFDNLDDKLCINKYKIDDKNLKFIKKIINKSYHKISVNTNYNQLETQSLISYLILIGEGYELLKDKDEWNTIIKNLMMELKSRIESGYINRVSLLSGFSEVGFAISIIVDKTGNYKNFKKQFDDYLLSCMESSIDKLISVEHNCLVEYYDLITGVSGWVSYLIQFSTYKEYKNVVTKMIKYIINIVNFKIENNNSIPKWYVKNENLAMESDRENNPNGCVNYSLSHGIGGMLYALSIAYKNNICIDGQKEAIEILVNEFINSTTYNKENIMNWPGMVDLNNYLNNIYEPVIYRSSWCYGNIGIMCCLYQAAEALKDNSLQEIIKNQSLLILEQNTDEYFLNSPVICHGYSGILIYFLCYNKIDNSIVINNKITDLTNKLLNMYDEDSEHGFYDILFSLNEQSNKIIKKDSKSLLDGSIGCVITLLMLLKNNIRLPHYLAYM